MKYIDTHAHLNLTQFDTDRTEVFSKCASEDVGMINIGTRKATSQLAVDLANQYDNAWAMVGLHPCSVVATDPDDSGNDHIEPEFDFEFYTKLALADKTVGIGECGFDYCHNADDTYEQQREVFLAQIALANEVNKPLMLHLRNSPDPGGRNAYDDALEIIASEAQVSGNAHFYAGTIDQAKRFFDLGFTISFTGVVTFPAHKPGIQDYLDVVEYAPLHMIHAETDCPYVAPAPYRGQRCEPWMVQEVVAKIAEQKGVSLSQLQEQLWNNATTLYQLG